MYLRRINRDYQIVDLAVRTAEGQCQEELIGAVAEFHIDHFEGDRGSIAGKTQIKSTLGKFIFENIAYRISIHQNLKALCTRSGSRYDQRKIYIAVRIAVAVLGGGKFETTLGWATVGASKTGAEITGCIIGIGDLDAVRLAVARKQQRKDSAVSVRVVETLRRISVNADRELIAAILVSNFKKDRYFVVGITVSIEDDRTVERTGGRQTIFRDDGYRIGAAGII